ncbi:nucleolar protein 12-domain-containing protein [Syncephalis plumigaleata]|nr:nucleolar protein 12-domain-containing protein [Syncephalis plumigaleata]
MDNAQILTAGARTYAKKRKLRDAQVQEITFDDEVRKSFLTGFQKRKQERKALAKQKALERERQERLEERKMRREAKEEMKQKRREEYESYAKQFRTESDNDDNQEEPSLASEDNETEGQDPWHVQPNNTAQFTGKTSTTTVTVITDIDDEASIDEAARQSAEARAKAAANRDNETETAQIQAQLDKLEKAQKKKGTKKFRYDTKAARKAAHSKIRATKSNRKASRKSA